MHTIVTPPVILWGVLQGCFARTQVMEGFSRLSII